MIIKTYRFSGLTPLLMANVQAIGKDIPALKLGAKPNDGDIEAIAEAHAYRDDDGSLYVPCTALRSSLLAGCSGQKLKGTRVGPAKLFQATVFPAEERATVLNLKGKPVKDYRIQIDSGVNGSTKARIVIVRPAVDDWHLDVPIEIDDEFAPSNFDEYLETVLAIWNRAGRVAGIGAWRPEKKGRHGRYEVEVLQ